MSDNFKPTIFIGSSKEGFDVAKLVESNLKDIGKITVWTKIFDLNKSTFENLTSQLSFYDYAILIATADDVTISRKKWILRFDLCQSFRSDGASYYGSNDATLVV